MAGTARGGTRHLGLTHTAGQAMDGLWTEVCGQPKQSNDPIDWAPVTRKRHTMPHSAQSQHANYWAPRTRKRRQQEHRPQRPTESSNPTQHAKGRTGDRPGPRKGATTRRNVTQGVGIELLFCLAFWDRGRACVRVGGCIYRACQMTVIEREQSNQR